jgi:serine/threonine protein kinase
LKKPNKTKQLLQQALGMNSEERTVLLEQINDPTLRSQLETLLADKNQQQDFLQKNTSTQATDRTDILSPGAKINRIRIEKMLGQGGMGSVYLGFDEKLERQVAVKSIRSEHLQNPATQQRFVREAQIMSKINHPSICQLYDYLETEAGDFLVMEYIEGQPLYKTPLTETQKLQVLADLAGALAVAHEHGIVHRDLKPDNIMITNQGQLKVLDFGIAQSLSQPKEAASTDTKNLDPALTQQGSLVGTIRYMSPEQAQGKTIQTASDMYALGIITQEVFSHEAAYQVLETNQLLTDVQQGKRKPADLPAPVSKLIDQLTQLQPEDRPTAEQTVEQISAIQYAPKRRRKQLIKYSILGAVLVLLAVLLWQWLQMGTQAERDLLIKDYEGQIADLVKQSEQIYVLPIHPVDTEINQLLQQAQMLFGTIENDDRLTKVDKKRLQGIIMLEAEYYGQAIPLLEAGQAENKLMADAWSKLFVEKATEYADEFGIELTMKAKELRKDFLQPALDYIEKTALETGKQDPLHEAFVLSQTNTLESGLNKANEILAAEHWNRDAVELKAMILSAMMARAREQGDWEQAKIYAEQTVETYELSTQMARSYPVDYSNLCYVNMGLAVDAIQRTGQGIEHYLEKAKTACHNTLIIQPQNTYPMNLLAVIYMLEAQWQIATGQTPNEALNQAKQWNQKTKDLNESIINSWNMALIHATEAKNEMMQGSDAMPKLEKSMALFDEILSIDNNNPSVISDMLFVMSHVAHEQVRRDQPHQATIEQAKALFDEAMLKPNILVSEQRGLVINLAEVLKVDLQLAFEQSSELVQDKATRLIAFLDPNDNLIKDDPLQLSNLANAHYLLAKYLHQQQKPLQEHLDKAANYIGQAQQIHQRNHYVQLVAAGIYSLQHILNNQSFNDSNPLFESAIAINPKNPYGYHAWADSLLLHAQNQDSADTKAMIVDQGLEKIEMALKIDPENPRFIKTKETLHAMKP